MSGPMDTPGPLRILTVNVDLDVNGGITWSVEGLALDALVAVERCRSDRIAAERVMDQLYRSATRVVWRSEDVAGATE